MLKPLQTLNSPQDGLTMRLSDDDLARFADWSGDRNPLHLDREVARRTYFGRPIAQGILAIIEALAGGGRSARPLNGLEVEFRGAVYPNDTYEVQSLREQNQLSVAVRDGATTALTIRGDFAGGSQTPSSVDLSWLGAAAKGSRSEENHKRRSPADHAINDLQSGFQASGVYSASAPPKAYISGGYLTPLSARVLGLCSYLVGMEAPGLRSLFTRLRVVFHDTACDSTELAYRLRVTRCDRQFRIVDTALEVATPDGKPVATAELRSYVRFCPLVTDLADLAATLDPSTSQLAGKVALVCGGSRGLGADLTAALALAGCQVYASYRSSSDEAHNLVRRLRQYGADAELLPGDVGDAAWSTSALDTIVDRHGQLDLLVLNACSSPSPLSVSADSGTMFEDYLSRNLRLARSPLTAFLPTLEENGGAVVAVSSSFVDEPPANLPHYVALKQSVEGMIRSASQECPRISCYIARPPRLQTSWNDTPTGVLGAIPSSRAASRIVNALASDWRPGLVDVLSDFSYTPSVIAEDTEVQEPADFRLVISASFTAEPLLPALRFWFNELGLAADAEMAPYGQVLQELVNPASALSANDQGVGAILLRVRDWLRELPGERTGSIDEVRAYLEETANQFVRAVRTHRSHAASETLLVLCPSNGSAASEEDELLGRIESGIREALEELPGIQVVVSNAFHEHYCVDEDAVADPLRDEIGHIPYKDVYFHTLATIIMRHVHRKLLPVRKVVVVDCDNTLWRGVVGEVGPEGVAFDAAHRELHAALTTLSQSGTLVCLCSKNEEPDVWSVFQTREDCGLPRDQIVAAMINWLPKSENLRTLASRLNLGLDSFIFIDDNPVECAEVRSGCPEVLVLEWPTTPERAQRLLRHTWELDVAKGTKEDHRRTQLYREEFGRQELQEKTLSFQDFIDSLELEIDICPLADEDLPRASQLTMRTNQFNFTTRRRKEGELQSLVSGGQYECWTARVRDRFGDYGLVGLLVTETQGELLVVDTFILSCRVLGRGVEHRLAAELGQIAKERGAGHVRLRVEATKRNAPARAFLEAISPAEYQRCSEGMLECDLPSTYLSELRFEPKDEGGPSQSETNRSRNLDVGIIDGEHIRRREQQIVRAAYELSTARELHAAIDGESTECARRSRSVQSGDVRSYVYEVFAGSLRLPVNTLEEVDQLESLGCDSFKIVEITVALIEEFPWLPTTLLFEHRCISEIVQHITQLSQSEGELAVSAHARPQALSAARGVDVPQSADIAVVGMNVRCAGANSADELWELLSLGDSSIEPVSPDRPCFLGQLNDDRPHWAGLMDKVDRFDAEFFGVSPREAEFMDPQLRLFLEVAWGALEDAGSTGVDENVDTGVYVGVMYGDYGYRANIVAGQTGNPYRCWEGFSLANRLSQILGFRGPSFAINTACSSSGTALHVACKALIAGECSAAVVGGVSLILDPDRFAQLGRLGILSPTGKCQPFGAEADGTVLGEGVAVVVLRPLDEARRRGDRIYGVIKGSALSHGTGTVGFTAPNPHAQAEAIRQSLKAARIDPRTITYVETHGTGTSLGDPIEVRGLELAFADRQLWDNEIRVTQRCQLGSVKPNIGHLEAGAGVLGLIKVLLQFDRGYLLPSLTSREPNPQIAFERLPFDIQRTLEPWERPVMEVDGATATVPRRAGLSSFGVGGSNAHIILEEAPPATTDDKAGMDRPCHLLTLSARHSDSLTEQVVRIKQHLESHTDLAIEDVCHTANVGRKHFEERLALITSSRDEMLRSLDEFAAGRMPSSCVQGRALRRESGAKLAFLFTGQGSQYAGMGRGLYDTHPVFRKTLDRCADILEPLLERPLLDVVFAKSESPGAELLNQTEYTQPALFALEYALGELWQSWGIKPDVVMGHSLGEIAAVCIAGGMSVEDGLKLVAARGRLMQALPPGGVMSAVRAEEACIRDAITGFGDRVSIAAVNGPRQIVISGEGIAIAEITRRLEADGIKTKALTVSHAFHSPLMEPMMADYESVAREVTFSEPQTPFISCVTGKLADDEVTNAEYWLRQVRDTVRFADAVAALDAQGVNAYLEIGPQPVLLAMARACVPDADARWLPSLRKDADAWHPLLESLANLYVCGEAVDWKAFDSPYKRQRVPMPTYPFRRKRYWIEAPIGADDIPRLSPTAPVQEQGECGRKSAAEELYELVWLDRPREANGRPRKTAGHWVILMDKSGIGLALVDALRAHDARCSVVLPGDRFSHAKDGSYEVDPRRPGDFEKLWSSITSNGESVRGVVHLWALDAPSPDSLTIEGLERTRQLALESVLHFMQTLAKAGPSPAPAVWLVTRAAVAVNQAAADEPLSVAQAPLWGLGRVAALEHPDLWGGLVDLASDEEVASEAEALACELLAPDGEDQIAIRNGTRFVPRLRKRRIQPTREVHLNGEGAYLVTGGLGALGLQVAQWLVSKGAQHLVLTGRRGMGTPGAEKAVRALAESGVCVEVVPADITREEDVEKVLRRVDACTTKLCGVVHAAGVDTQVPLVSMTADDLKAISAPKMEGGWLLHERTRHMQLDLFVCFSSIASVWGSAGRAHYGAANAFLDSLVHERRRMGLAGLCVNWGPWKGGGMATPDDLALLERMGNRGLDPAIALEALDILLGGGDVQATVADMDWPRFCAVYEVRGPRPLLSEVNGAVRPEQTGAAARVARPSPTIRDQPGDSRGVAGGESTPAWIDRLRKIPLEQRHTELVRLLRNEIAETLRFEDPREVRLDMDFAEMGMDSLMAVEFAARLHKRLGISASASTFDHPSIEALAGCLLDELALPESSNTRVGHPSLNGNGPPGWNQPILAGGRAEFAERLRQAPPERRAGLVEELLREEVAETLGFADPQEVRVDQAWSDMGMDSLAAVNFASRLQKSIGIANLPQVFDNPHIRALAAHLLGELTPTDEHGITGYAPELEEQVFALERTLYPEHNPEWILPRWRWMFLESAKRLGVAPRVWLYRDGDRVVGQMGALPLKLKVGEREETTAWLVDTMVLESHRNQAIGAKILMQAREDLPFALSLGQTAEMRQMLYRLGWQRVAPLETYVLPLHPYRIVRDKLPHRSLACVVGASLKASCATKRLLKARKRASLDVAVIERFDEQHDELWEAVKDSYPCAVVRDASYLNWKYVAQPGQDFIRLEFSRHEQVVAVAVISISEPDSGYQYRRAFLVELVISPADQGALLGVLDGLRRECCELGSDAIFFHVINRRLAAAARAYGFLRREPTRFLLICPEHDLQEVREAALTPENWLITMGDSDIDRPW